jgi:hypothetical protein
MHSASAEVTKSLLVIASMTCCLEILSELVVYVKLHVVLC